MPAADRFAVFTDQKSAPKSIFRGFDKYQPAAIRQLPDNDFGHFGDGAGNDDGVVGRLPGVTGRQRAFHDGHVIDLQFSQQFGGAGGKTGVLFQGDDGPGEARQHRRRIAGGAADIEDHIVAANLRRLQQHGEGHGFHQIAAAAEGFTAVRFTPFSKDYYLHKSYTEWADEAVERVGAVKEAVGSDVDICVETPRQMAPAESIGLGRRLEQFNPFFYEDPMLPDSPAIMGDVAEQCGIPIATGERFTTIFEYQQLLEAKAASYVRPDLCLCGGLSGCKKVAAMAEAQHVKVIPHNPLSPVSTAACVQLDACIPNFALQEYTGESEPPKSDLLVTPLELVEGYLIVPEGPGLGIELNEAALSGPENPKILDTPIGFDGSVQDR